MRKRAASLVASVALAVGAVVATGGSAAADTNGWCDGWEVETCVYLDVEGTSVRARANIKDEPSDTKNFDIDVDQVKVQRWNPATRSWVDRVSKEEPGWETAPSDWFTTGFVVACDAAHPGVTATFRAVAHYRWRLHGGSADGEWMPTDGRVVPCRVG